MSATLFGCNFPEIKHWKHVAFLRFAGFRGIFEAINCTHVRLRALNVRGGVRLHSSCVWCHSLNLRSRSETTHFNHRSISIKSRHANKAARVGKQRSSMYNWFDDVLTFEPQSALKTRPSTLRKRTYSFLTQSSHVLLLLREEVNV